MIPLSVNCDFVLNIYGSGCAEKLKSVSFVLRKLPVQGFALPAFKSCHFCTEEGDCMVVKVTKENTVSISEEGSETMGLGLG